MYSNSHSRNIAERVERNKKRHLARQEKDAAMGGTSFTPQLEGVALRDANVEGGSGYAEATLRGHGFLGCNQKSSWMR